MECCEIATSNVKLATLFHVFAYLINYFINTYIFVSKLTILRVQFLEMYLILLLLISMCDCIIFCIIRL